MRLMIAAVGKLKDGGESDLFDRYRKRLDATGRSVSLGPVSLVELPESRLQTTDLRKADEAARLLKTAERCDGLIALDEHGGGVSSEAFASRLAALRDGGTASLAFLIGGPDGHGAEVLQRARSTLSLSPMTLAHGLARVVLAEQLYRAATILSGHPYHRA